MLDELEIRKEIARLEYEEASYPNYSKLAALYVIREEMKKTAETAPPVETQLERGYSSAAEPQMEAKIGRYGDSDFLIALASKSPADIWPLLDELMASLQVMQPRTYASVMRRIENL